MKHTALWLILLLSFLMLTSCYTDHDPWPAADGLDTPQAFSTATQAPAATEAAVYVTVSPVPATPVPTEIPGGNDEPGING